MSSDLVLNYGPNEREFRRVIRVNQTLRPNHKKSIVDPYKAFINAISEPRGEAPLVDKIEKAKKIALIIGDRRYIKQQIQILNYTLDLLKNFPKENISIFLASADRSKLTLKDIGVPEEIIKNYEFIQHNSRADDCVYIGLTKSNTQVKINKRLLQFDLKIGIDIVRPHLFAGYTGGGQIILPGLSHYKTIEANHSMRVKETSVLGNYLNNPVKVDMNEAAEFVDNLFVINSVLTREGNFYRILSGGVSQAFAEAAEAARSVYTVPAKKTDIVIVSGGFEFTTNLYQAGKLIGAAGLVLNGGGIVILLAKCGNGSGNQMEFLENVYQKSLMNYLPVSHKIFLVSDLPKETLKDTIYTPFTNLDDAQGEAMKLLGKEATLSILHNTEHIVPKVE
jgi:lactate racemase